MSWPTLTETFNYLQIDEGALTPEELQIYTQEREVVIASIEDYCERKFARNTTTETKQIRHYQKVLKTDQYPVNSISSIKLNGVDYESYVLDAERGLLYSQVVDTYSIYSSTSRRFFEVGEYVIEYDFGFDELPTLLLSVYYDLFLYRYNYRINQTSNIDLSQIKRASVAGVATVEFNSGNNSKQFNQQWVEYLNSHQDVLNKFISERGVSFDA